MKKITITYLSLLLILTSLFSTPVSVLANTEAETEDENVELEVTEEAVGEESEPPEAASDEESEVTEEEPAEEPSLESEEEVTEEEAVEEVAEEPETETEEVTEEENTEEEAAEEEADEERYGFSLEITEALNAEGNVFTEEEGLDQEESFTLRLASLLDSDQNYQSEDVETVTLPASVYVAAADQGTVQSNGTDTATYQVHENGEIEFTFLEAVESAGAVDEPIDVEVFVNENSIDEEFAYIVSTE